MKLETGDDSDGEGIRLTPLIDVVFLLLIFFLTATTFSREEVEMDLDLPEAASGEAGGEQTIVINIAKDGRLVMDGRGVTEEALHQKLRAAAARNKDRQVLIRGDTEARYGIVAKVFDACLLARLRSISIGAVPQRVQKRDERAR